jgi:hypothetical protein
MHSMLPVLLLLLALALSLSPARGVDILATDAGLRWAGRVNVVGTDVQFDYPGVGVTFTVVGTSTVDMVVRQLAWRRCPLPNVYSQKCREGRRVSFHWG